MCFTILQIAYVSVVLFLLMGRERWGWKLALAGSLIFMTSRIAQLDIAIRFPAMIENDWIGIIVASITIALAVTMPGRMIHHI